MVPQKEESDGTRSITTHSRRKKSKRRTDSESDYSSLFANAVVVRLEVKYQLRLLPGQQYSSHNPFFKGHTLIIVTDKHLLPWKQISRHTCEHLCMDERINRKELKEDTSNLSHDIKPTIQNTTSNLRSKTDPGRILDVFVRFGLFDYSLHLNYVW